MLNHTQPISRRRARGNIDAEGTHLRSDHIGHRQQRGEAGGRVPRMLSFGSSSIHSCSVWAPPPRPPEPMRSAGMPRLMGRFASVEDAPNCVRNPCASMATLPVAPAHPGGLCGQRGGRQSA